MCRSRVLIICQNKEQGLKKKKSGLILSFVFSNVHVHSPSIVQYTVYVEYSLQCQCAVHTGDVNGVVLVGVVLRGKNGVRVVLLVQTFSLQFRLYNFMRL